MAKLEWNRLTEDSMVDGHRVGFTYGCTTARNRDGLPVGDVYACNHGQGWTVNASTTFTPCGSQAEAEALAEHVALLLERLQVATQAHLARLRKVRKPK